MYNKKPWLKFYGNVPESIDYPSITLYEALMNTVERVPEAVAYEFLGYTSSYRQLGAEIDCFAEALSHLGLKKGDRITIAMPTCPQGIICFYAANKLGAVSSMIHPLSPPAEVEFYLNLSKSRLALTLDAFYEKFKAVQPKTGLETLILSQIPDYLGWIKRIGFKLTKGSKIPPVPDDPMVAWWQDLMKGGCPAAPKAEMDTRDMAVILYSGGTTGKPKGIMLSNRNFISEGMQVEDTLYQHPDVLDACVIGVPDELQVERVKGFVVLKTGVPTGAEKEAELIKHCRKHLIKWSCPREIEFREDLPKTLIGKVAFNEFLKEEVEKLKARGEYAG